MLTVKRRKDAAKSGEVRYFTGKPCPRGHIGLRFVSTGSCCQCLADRCRDDYEKRGDYHRDRVRRYRAANPDAVKESNRRSRSKHREEVVARGREWRAANPELMREIKKRYREKNADKIRERDRRRREENPEKVREFSRKWERSNPEARRAINANRRARVRDAEGSFTVADIERITTLQHGKCACCNKKKKLTVDHIVPLSGGGSNWPRNIQMLCKPCNSRKKAKDPIDYARDRGMLL